MAQIRAVFVGGSGTLKLSGSFEIAEEGEGRGGRRGAASQLPCKPPPPYDYLQRGARTIKGDPGASCFEYAGSFMSGFFARQMRRRIGRAGQLYPSVPCEGR